MPHPIESKFPNLCKKYSKHENIAHILSAMDTYCKHLFSLEGLEQLLEGLELLSGEDWKDSTTEHYLKFFEACIDHSGKEHSVPEVCESLLPYIHTQINGSEWSQRSYITPKPCPQIGFIEKFSQRTLQSDLAKRDVLKEYAFTTLDMSRTAKASTEKAPVVLELDHFQYLKELPADKPFYIRSSFGDATGLSQWILLYFKDNKPILYSESPISEQDKNILAKFLGKDTKDITIEGGAAALSMSSGMRACAHYIEHVGGAALSSAADYFSLLIEWVWFLNNSGSFIATDFTWIYFQEHVLRYSGGQFNLLDFEPKSKSEESLSTNKHLQMRSYFLGLDQTLADKALKILDIDPKTHSVTLTVPEDINISQLVTTNSQYSAKVKYSIQSGLNFLTKKTDEDVPQDENANIATAFVLNVFRACAKQKNLIITLPIKYQLDRQEQKLVCFLMQNNPFVCEFTNTNNNASLVVIKNRLQHIFARNRWLSINDYLPPLLDEFWMVAAGYWIAYLKKSPDLLSDDAEVKEFKRCVNEMGISGLTALLKYLIDKEIDLKPEFNKLLKNTEKPPVFYAGCPAAEVEQYTEALTQHLEHDGYFPFRQFQFAFVAGANEPIINLLQKLNKFELIEKISLTNCLTSEASIAALKEFLLSVIKRAQDDNNWICPVNIPELEKPYQYADFAEIVKLYGQLNNILIQRARKKIATELFDIECFKQAQAHGAPAVAAEEKILAGEAKKDLGRDHLLREFNKGADKIWPDITTTPLPLLRSGGIALQMQQQQQIKQERSRSLENEMEKGTTYEDVLPSLLIDYRNIDKELGEYFEELSEKISLDQTKATLKRSGASELQDFFHTWVNANPEVSAKHTIQKMTLHAAKMLLKHHRQLSGGLNVYNLPRGFYTQRMASGELVLGYKSTLNYTTDHNPLTLQLTTAIPEVERILGNYLQFGSESEDSKWDYLRLLAEMQPGLTADERRQRYDDFQRNEGHFTDELKKFLGSKKSLIIKHWELFYSVYHSSSVDELIDFFGSTEIELSRDESIQLLTAKIYLDSSKGEQKERIIGLLQRQSGDYTRALGQIYSRYEDYGIERFSNLLLNIEDRLGEPFLDAFFTDYLARCQTFSPLLQDNALNTLEELIQELSGDDREKEFFVEFLKLQMSAVGWEDITTLWKGFRYFYSRIKDMSLDEEFTPELLSSINPQRQNMFSCFERILKSLENIPNQELRKEFIKKLGTIDLTEGGVPYAVCHEGFVIVDPSLQLTDFKEGSPTYVPPMLMLFADSWESPLHTNRALGSTSHIKPADYKRLSAEDLSKNQLIWAIHSEWYNAEEFLEFINKQGYGFKSAIAQHFFCVFYEKNLAYRRFPLSVFEVLSHEQSQVQIILNKYSTRITLFECINIVPDASKKAELGRVITLFDNAPEDHKQLEQGLLLATVFGVTKNELQQFYEATEKLRLITRNELTVLSNQLLSLDFNSLPDNEKEKTEVWNSIVAGIQRMDENPRDIVDYRRQLMLGLKERFKLVFKSSVAGDYRMVIEDDLKLLGLEQFFEQHSPRLKIFFKEHIAISEAEKGEFPLKPIVEFFKRLQLNKTYINEVEPLLATLERILEQYPTQCWTAAYFNGLLRVLQPQDNAGFPIGVLEAVLTEPKSPFIPTLIDNLQPEFDKEGKWQGIFGSILSKGESFTRVQQANLARLAIRTIQEPDFINGLISNLVHTDYEGLRDVILTRLLNTEIEQLNAAFKQCASLVHLEHTEFSEEVWKATCQLWIETLTQHPKLEERLINKGIEQIDKDKRALILHIVAWSSFPSHRHPTVPRSDYFTGKFPKVIKLIHQLSELSIAELTELSNCFPGKPAPDTKDLLIFVHKKDQQPISESLQDFLTKGQSAFRQDYQQLSSTREDDLSRMLELTYVTRAQENDPLAPEYGVKLTLMFQYLKQIEQGVTKVNRSDTPISNMSKEELQKAFREYSKASKENPDNILLKTKVWAILFEVLGRTTGKYPHLAQQFALIANDVLLAKDPSSILQLKTGEGKSHFVAMRAARHAGLGKKVDVCTAKWSLAERDLLDYKQFFDYLDIRTANIHARSTRETFMDADVIYTTPGDLSLFLDEQASQGNPVPEEPKNRVGLGDEFDFLYYEGQKIQFNYARHTGITPKQMNWFYRGINEFYEQHILSDEHISSSEDKLHINKGIVRACFAFLCGKASDEGRLYLESIEPMVLLGWLQSAHEAASLQIGVNYTVRLEQVRIGQEEFPLREIYPLTKDMQAAVGSTFSHGVHQLLAERLNRAAQLINEAQNYHVHPESKIISSQVFSQRLKTLWSHWEGFTGTVSASQANELHQAHKTAVLRVPTNQKDLRKWPDAEFFDNEPSRFDKMVDDIKQRIRNKKSILLCCSTDAEVLEVIKRIKPYFSDSEYQQHFLSYTNESHESPADILRRKKAMEGDYLGQKQHGVVLIAAGFGRGDNVDVETVMLTSVHDENDLGQKGGRTARNGEEGEVLQYYITKDIDRELTGLVNVLTDSGLQEEVLQELECTQSELHDFVSKPKDINLSMYEPQVKFSFILRLREFIAAKDNYLSLIYHEAKAKISSEGIRKIGAAPVEKKEQLIKDFAEYLDDLEKKWMSIQIRHRANSEECIALLEEYIAQGCEAPNGRLYELFEAPFAFKPNESQKPSFILDKVAKPRTPVEQLMPAIQSLLLKLEDLPENVSSWNKLIKHIAQMSERQLKLLLHIYSLKPSFKFAELQAQAFAIVEEHKVTKQIEEHIHDSKLDDISQLDIKIEEQKQLRAALEGMPGQASDLALDYLLTPEYDSNEPIVTALPMLTYSSSNTELSLSFWQNSVTRDNLLSLPAACFAEPIYLDARILLGIKNFLDRFIDVKTNEQKYSTVFNQFLRGVEHQSEHRKRLFTQYASILKGSKKESVELLEQLALLSETLKAPEHLHVLQHLIVKMQREYQQDRVDISELDALWDNLAKLAQSGRFVEFLPLIEVNLRIDGIEFIARLNSMCQLDPNFVLESQQFLKEYFPQNQRKIKREKIAEYRNVVHEMQDTFAGQGFALDQLFATFKDYFFSDEFENYRDKKLLLSGMKHIVKAGIKDDELISRFANPQKMTHLLYLTYHIPEQVNALVQMDMFSDYLAQAVSDGDRAIYIEGIKALLDSVSPRTHLEVIKASLDKLHHDKEKVRGLLVLCPKYPEYAEILLSQESFINYVKDQNFKLSREDIIGIRALLEHIPPKVLKEKLAGLTKTTMHQLLILIAHFPNHAEDLLSIRDVMPAYFNSDYYQKETTGTQQRISHAGLQQLLAAGVIRREPKITARLSKLSNEQIEKLLMLCKSFPNFIRGPIDEHFSPWINYLCSRHYKTLSKEKQSDAFEGMRALLKATISKEKQSDAFEGMRALLKATMVFSKHGGIAQFSDPKEMELLLVLATKFPHHGRHLLALKPLMSYIIANPEKKEAMITFIGHLLENIQATKTPFNVVQMRLKSFSPQQILRLTDYCQANKGHEVAIMCSGLPKRITKITEEQRGLIDDFYQQKDKKQWIKKEFMEMSSQRRIALMSLLKEGSFVSQEKITRGVFTTRKNADLFEMGLSQYRDYAESVLYASEPKSQTRDLSFRQQTELLAVMGELEAIGKAPPLVSVRYDAAKDKLNSKIQRHVKRYEDLSRKDNERYKKVQAQISGLVGMTAIAGTKYKELMSTIREMKIELMKQDVAKASKQILPTLHFWGQSRLYKTFNDIEDLILKSWVKDAHCDVSVSEHFNQSYLDTRNEFIQTFRESLKSWKGARNSKSLMLFKTSANLMCNEISKMDDEELVDYLKKYPKKISDLPGTLRAIAQEVLAHDANISSELKASGLGL